jgi:hypothetical protein
MSDISFEFAWYELALAALLFSSPGLLLGCVVGAVAWRRHRVYGGALGAVIGSVLALGVEFLWR